MIEEAASLEDLWRRTVEATVQSGLVEQHERIVLTGGTRLNQPGATDHILVHVVE